MTDPFAPEALQLVAAYLGASPEELAPDWHPGAALDVVAARYGRPPVGLRELVVQTFGGRPASR